MEQKITELQSRPSVHVEKLEYKFDQLKVEKLEGTLNIGLNPTDLQGDRGLFCSKQKWNDIPESKNGIVY